MTRISWLDVKLGLRMLIKHPGLSLVGGLAIAVATAVSVGSFAFLYHNLYPNIPLDEGDRIVALENWDVRMNHREGHALFDLAAWRGEMRTVREIGAFRDVRRNLALAGATPEPVELAEMTATGFQVARVRPLLGRPLVPADERADAAPVLVLGYRAWRARFGADRGVVGRTVSLDGVAHTVVGVMPQGFAFPVAHDLWVPLRDHPGGYEPGLGPEVYIFGRLAAGATERQAQAELSTLGRRAAAAHPRTHEKLQPRVLPYTQPLTGLQGMTALSMLPYQLMITALLLVVAVNVAVLTYARTASRTGEIAVRTAIGASRARIVTQLFVEALVLSAVASAVGLAVAQYGLGEVDRLISSDGGGSPFWTDYSLSLPVVAYTAVLALFTAVVAGVIPALQATGRRLRAPLSSLGGGSAGGGMGRAWTVMVVAQVAFAVAAIPLATGLGWDAMGGAATRPTYPAGQYLIAGVALQGEPPVREDSGAYWRGMDTKYGVLREELSRALATEPGVSSVVFITEVPGTGRSRGVEVDRGVPDPRRRNPGINRVEPGFFHHFGARVLAGRVFTGADLGAAVEPAVVNRTFVSRYLGGGAAVGRRFRYADEVEAGGDAPWHEIVGVVEDLAANPVDADKVQAVIYHPLASDEVHNAMLSIRFAGAAPGGFTGRLRSMAAALDPALRVGTVRTMDDVGREVVRPVRMLGAGIATLIASVLLLSAAGIYALVSFTVARRRREIGIRAALGAQPRRLLAGVFRRAAGQLAVGLAIGLAAALLLDLATGGGIMGARALVLLPAVAALMLVVGLLAAAGPARRGMRIEPSEALRAE